MHIVLFLRNGGFFFLTEIKLYTNNTKIDRKTRAYPMPEKKVKPVTSYSLCAKIRIDFKTLTV